MGMELSPVDVRDADEIERGIMAFARSPNGGLIVTASVLATRHRDLIVMLAARHKLPAVYAGRWMVTGGGLVPTDLTTSISSARQPTTSIASLRARSRPISRCNLQRSTTR